MKRGWAAVAGAALVIAACSGDDGAGTGTTSTVTSSPPSTVASSTISTEGGNTTQASPSTTESTTSTSSASTSSGGPTTSASLACVAGWSVRQQVAQLVMPGVRGEDLAAVGPGLVQAHVGGVLVMTWPEGLDASTLQPFRTGDVPMLVAVDEEGGQVQRLRRLGKIPAAADVAATMTMDEARRMIAEHAKIVAALGFTTVFAPVVDVSFPDSGGPIGDRSFGDDADIVSVYAGSYVLGWQSAGIMPVLKHFPGHGRATADSHNGASVTPPLSELDQIDLMPYRELAGSGAGVMVGHLDVPGLTEEGVPASLSPAAITGLLRGQLGYGDALVFTDALGMSAIATRFSVTDAAVRAIAAGADVALLSGPADVPGVIDALAAAVDAGTITADRLASALTHVLSAKHLSCSPGG